MPNRFDEINDDLILKRTNEKLLSYFQQVFNLSQFVTGQMRIFKYLLHHLDNIFKPDELVTIIHKMSKDSVFLSKIVENNELGYPPIYEIDRGENLYTGIQTAIETVEHIIDSKQALTILKRLGLQAKYQNSYIYHVDKSNYSVFLLNWFENLTDGYSSALFETRTKYSSRENEYLLLHPCPLYFLLIRYEEEIENSLIIPKGDDIVEAAGNLGSAYGFLEMLPIICGVEDAVSTWQKSHINILHLISRTL